MLKALVKVTMSLMRTQHKSVGTPRIIMQTNNRILVAFGLMFMMLAGCNCGCMLCGGGGGGGGAGAGAGGGGGGAGAGAGGGAGGAGRFILAQGFAGAPFPVGSLARVPLING